MNKPLHHEAPPIGGPDIVRLIERAALPLGDEKTLQAEMASVFDGAGIAYEREKRLGDKDILDFMIAGGIAVEVKIKGGRMEIFRQVSRYCAHAEVTSLVLATAVAMSLPISNGKPTFVASLGRGWL